LQTKKQRNREKKGEYYIKEVARDSNTMLNKGLGNNKNVNNTNKVLPRMSELIKLIFREESAEIKELGWLGVSKPFIEISHRVL
jgi:hypothetical protein